MIKHLRVYLTIALFMGLTLTSAFAGLFGYTSKTNLPDHIKKIYIAPVQNDIDIAEEISDKERFKPYRPGLEVELTNGIINRFIFDGTLEVGSEKDNDAVLEASVKEYRRDVLRYTDGDEVEEYRLSVKVQFSVRDAHTGQVLVQATTISGDSDYFLSGSRAVSEDAAAQKAVEDAARRVVEKTIETW